MVLRKAIQNSGREGYVTVHLDTVDAETSFFFHSESVFFCLFPKEPYGRQTGGVFPSLLCSAVEAQGGSRVTTRMRTPRQEAWPRSGRGHGLLPREHRWQPDPSGFCTGRGFRGCRRCHLLGKALGLVYIQSKLIYNCKRRQHYPSGQHKTRSSRGGGGPSVQHVVDDTYFRLLLHGQF
jgi:hypothetical protein